MSDKIEFLDNFFYFLNNENFNFAILRGFNNLDSCTIHNDLDILIEDYEHKKLSKYFFNNQFSKRIDKFDYLYGAKPHIHFLNNNLDLHFDIVDGLYYCSLNDNRTFLPVDDQVTQSLLKNKLPVKNYFIPRSEDELLHLVCHCFYDKKKFATKHVIRIHELLDSINVDYFLKLLKLVFGSMYKIIFTHIQRDSFDNFHNEIISYSEY